MPRDSLNDLVAFIAVAREQSFTRAAAQLGVSQSALSHSMRSLETKLGVRLLTRTTRSVSPTAAGQRLMDSLAPRLDEIWNELEAVGEMRDKPTGTVRISATDYAISYVLWPKLKELLRQFPDINIELSNEYALTDIAANRFDAGVRLGDQITNGMISVRIGPDIKFLVVGSPSYFEKSGTPKTPEELINHKCINLRLSTHGGLYAWEFLKNGRELKVKVEGQLVFNDVFQIIQAASEGFGLAHVPEDMADEYISKGLLVSVLSEFCPQWDGHHLYYPSRRQSSKALTLVVDALRYRK